MRGLSVFLVINVIFFFSQTVRAGNHINVNDFLFNGGLEFVDLSHPLTNNTISWPGGETFHFTRKIAEFRPGGTWYSRNEFCADEHSGTHMDAPYHFNQNGLKVGQIPIDNLITPLLIVDLSKLVSGNSDFVLQRSHLDNLLNLDPKRNVTVIFRFGWSQFYGNKAKYMGAAVTTRNNLRFPGISEDVAKWLTENRNLVGVGVDTASVDPGSEMRGLAHVVLTSHNIFLLENVNIDRDLPSNLCSIIIMPMKIQEGTGAPTRVTAICPKLLSSF